MSSRIHYVPDPIQGTINLPQWLVEIMYEPAVRRMMFIRQLGLKSYIDFPGAIHTRYSHALGTMNLSGTLVDILIDKMRYNKGKKEVVSSLMANRNNIMAAGFFHDIAHGPFSHAVDFVMQKTTGKSHEQLAEDIIKRVIPAEIGDWGINKESVVQLTQPKKHSHPFLNHIINGPIDCDKLDYLLRDAYHVGLNYRFDLNHFLRTYTVLGDGANITRCILGLDPTKQAIVTAELFIVIWKSMYDLVYFVESSRIAEKMLEKALLLNKDDKAIREIFRVDQFIHYDDEQLLSLIENTGADTSRLLAARDPRKLYRNVWEDNLSIGRFEMKTEFIDSLGTDQDQVSDQLSKQLCALLGKKEYELICDIIRSKAPKEIYLDETDKEGQETELRMRSDVVGAIQPRDLLKVYVSPSIVNSIKKRDISKIMKQLIEGEVDIG